MKKLFLVLVCIVVVVVIAVAIGFYLLSRSADGMEKEAQAYIDANLPVIAASWDPAELVKRASPELMDVASKDQIAGLFAMFSQRLGPLREYKGSKGRVNVSFTFKKGRIITGAYSAQAVFEKARGLIECQLVKHGDRWQITSFRVNSDALARPPDNAATTT